MERPAQRAAWFEILGFEFGAFRLVARLTPSGSRTRFEFRALLE